MPLPEDYIRRLAPPPRSDSYLKCAVTGLPAKYRDPVTGAPYATVEAFKTLRANAANANAAGAPKAAAGTGFCFFPFFLLFPQKSKNTRSLCTEAPGSFYLLMIFPREYNSFSEWRTRKNRN